MKLRTWIFPDHGGIIPGIPGVFHGGSRIVVDEDTNTIHSVDSLNSPILPENSVKVSLTFDKQAIVTPEYIKKKSEDTDS